ncbi:MAG: DDE-type integrase/transposase/recombinase [Thiogranum sp.]|nr:DDE-type integrase/transposase/recombinase [Thiogranum sp.]
MISGAAFVPGQTINLRGQIGVIRLFDSDLAVIQFGDGQTQVIPPFELLRLHSERQLTLIQPTRPVRVAFQLTNHQRTIIQRRESYVRELHKHPNPCAKGVRESVIGKVSVAINDQNAPGISTLSRWYSDWIADGREMAFQVVYKARKKRALISPEVESLMEEIIHQVYLKRNKPTIRSAYRAFLARYNSLGYVAKVPDESTFRRRVYALDRLRVISARQGASQARAEARVAAGPIRVNYPLERVELDTAHFNLGLLNEDGAYVGKVSLYLVIDVYSRAVLGYAVAVGKAKETAGCVIHAIRHAISVKSDPDYPMYGLFHSVTTDSGPGYRAESVRYILNMLGSEHNIAPTHQGWGKPFVERFIYTLRTGLFSNLSGYLGKYDPKLYSDDTLIKSAKWTVAEFKDFLSHFIVHTYHNTPHSGLGGKTPIQAWNEGIQIAPPIAPADLNDLAKLRGLRATRVLQKHVGVTCQQQRFNSSGLQALYHLLHGNRKEREIKVDILVDPLDASAISVVNPQNGTLLDVPNVANVEPEISFAKLNAGRRRRNVNEAPVFAAKDVRAIRRRKNRNGAEVRLETDEDTLDLDALVRAPVRPESGWDALIPPNLRSLDEDEIEGDFDVI